MASMGDRRSERVRLGVRKPALSRQYAFRDPSSQNGDSSRRSPVLHHQTITAQLPCGGSLAPRALTQIEISHEARDVRFPGGMSHAVSLVLSPQTRRALEVMVEDRRRAVKHSLRARIVLLLDARLPVLEVVRHAGVSRPMVWRWQQRFAEEGLEGLLRDMTRPPATPATPQPDVQAMLERTLTGEPPGVTTHWTGRAMAAACGLSLRTVQRIWHAHRLQPIVYGPSSARPTPPGRQTRRRRGTLHGAAAPCRGAVDRREVPDSGTRSNEAWIAAQAGQVRDLHPRRCPQRHDRAVRCVEHVAGHRFGRCAPRHRHQEFIAFLDQVEDMVPAGKVIHASWTTMPFPSAPSAHLAGRRSAMDIPFTPTSCSWLNAAEGYFSKLTCQALRRGVFRSVDDLVTAIDGRVPWSGVARRER